MVSLTHGPRSSSCFSFLLSPIHGLPAAPRASTDGSASPRRASPQAAQLSLLCSLAPTPPSPVARRHPWWCRAPLPAQLPSTPPCTARRGCGRQWDLVARCGREAADAARPPAQRAASAGDPKLGRWRLRTAKARPTATQPRRGKEEESCRRAHAELATPLAVPLLCSASSRARLLRTPSPARPPHLLGSVTRGARHCCAVAGITGQIRQGRSSSRQFCAAGEPSRCIRPPQPLASAHRSSEHGLADDPHPPCSSMPRPRRARRLRCRPHGVGST